MGSVLARAGGDLKHVEGLAREEVGLEDLQDGLLVPAGGWGEAAARVLLVPREACLGRELHASGPELLLAWPEEQRGRRERAPRAGERERERSAGEASSMPAAQTVHAMALCPGRPAGRQLGKWQNAK